VNPTGVKVKAPERVALRPAGLV